MSQPVITTVIPTYKRPFLLKRAVESVLSQTYPHIEVCIFDNCSQDETKSIIKDIMKSDSRVRYHCHEKNLGALANILYAIKNIATDYFTILSDDDRLLPGFFDTAISLATQYPKAGFIALGCCIERNGRIVRYPLINKKNKGFHTPPDALLRILSNWAVPTWTSILFNKKIVDEIGSPLDENCMIFDLEFLMRIAAHQPIVFSDHEGAVFTDHPESSSSISDLDMIWPCYPRIIENIMNTYQIDEQIKKQVRNLLYIRFQKRLAYSLISSLRQKKWGDAETALTVFSEFNQGVWYHILALLVRLTRSFPNQLQPLISLFIQQKQAIVYILDKLRIR